MRVLNTNLFTCDVEVCVSVYNTCSVYGDVCQTLQQLSSGPAGSFRLCVCMCVFYGQIYLMISPDLRSKGKTHAAHLKTIEMEKVDKMKWVSLAFSLLPQP